MRIIALQIVLLLVLNLSLAQSIEQRKSFNVQKGLALEGYDPVSYFVKEKPLKGKPDLKYNYNGIIYYFSSSENLKKFQTTPSKFEPQYGGWCAYAMGESGEKVEVDPLTYKLKDGKLFLFYNFYFNNTLKKWNINEATLKTKADTNWSKIAFKQTNKT